MTELICLTICGVLGFCIGDLLANRRHERAEHERQRAEWNEDRRQFTAVLERIHRDEIEPVDDWPTELEER